MLLFVLNFLFKLSLPFFFFLFLRQTLDQVLALELCIIEPACVINLPPITVPQTSDAASSLLHVLAVGTY